MIGIVKIITLIMMTVINLILLPYSIYYFVTGLYTFFNKKHIIKKYEPKYKIAVIIAARNEEFVIGDLIGSIKKQKYPKELFDVFVVPNNCTDNTEKAALEAGANIIECKQIVSSKGEVLKYTFEYMAKNHSEYEAYAIFDADNLAHPNFLARMNDALCSGYKVAQGYRDSKNPSDTWISSCYSLYYWTQNYFFNKARMNLGWSSSINGTGFLIKKEVIDTYGFNTVTLTEDIEFAALCCLNDVKIAFVNDAITYDEQPLTFAESWKQRKRWSIGTIQCCKRYSKKLFKHKNMTGFDMGLFFLAPFIQILTALYIIILLINTSLGISQNFDIHIFRITNLITSNLFVFGVLGYMVSIGIGLFVVIVQRKKLKKAIKGIFTLIIFMASWIPINIIAIFSDKFEWEPIKHKVKVNINDIIEIDSKD